MPTNIGELKLKNPIREYIQRDLGNPEKSTPTYDMYFSPFRDDGIHPSFVVYNDRFKDFGNGEYSGDIIDYIMMRKNIDISNALSILTANMPLGKIERKKPDKPKQEVSLSKALQLSQNIRYGEAYYTLRGISKAIMGKSHLGVNVFAWYVFKHKIMPEPFYVHAPKYSIPNIVHLNNKSIIRGISYRAASYECIKKAIYDTYPVTDERYHAAAKIAWDLYPEEPRPSDALVKAICNTNRYTYEPGSKHLIYNADILLKKVPYVIVVEGQLDALMLMSHGYPSIALPMNRRIDLKSAFKNTSLVYIASDNDKHGDDLSMWVVSEIGVNKTIKLPHVDGCKDPGEMYTQGKLNNWIKNAGITPIKEIS